MADETLSFSSTYDTASEADWLNSVSKALKGGSIERLMRQTDDGITIKPLYRETDWPASEDPFGAPGTAPFIRGPRSERDPYLPWDIRQTFSHPDIEISRAEILRDLERGVSSLELAIDPSGDRGIAVQSVDDFKVLISDVDTSIAPIALSAARFQDQLTAAGWARESLQENSRLALNLDPLEALARTGLVAGGLEAAFQDLSHHLSASDRVNGTTLRADGRPVHEAGGSEAQELGALIASAVDTMRQLDAAGVATERSAAQILFTLSVDANYGLGVSKIRAARRLWARVLESLGLPASPMNIQAVTSRRMLTRYDPWVNLLRNTSACFAAGVGGADIVTVRPFTDALGVADELGRRTARNTQLIAQEEASLGKVADPAGGAWFIEKLADDLAHKAWTEFQAIEAEGGYGASLLADALQSRVGETRAKRAKSIAKGKLPMTGVSAFPTLEEIAAPVALPLSVSGGDIADDPVTENAAEASPLWPISLAEPFERLRDHAAAQPTQPSIFLATLGPLAEHNARADYARNLFAAGGIKAVEASAAPSSVRELVSAFDASGCALAILCGSDERYADEAEAAAEALKGAGVQRLYLAGRPGDHESAWRASGIDSFVHIGVDMVAALELAHAELGLSS